MTILLIALVAALWLAASALWLADRPSARLDVDRALSQADPFPVRQGRDLAA